MSENYVCELMVESEEEAMSAALSIADDEEIQGDVIWFNDPKHPMKPKDLGYFGQMIAGEEGKKVGIIAHEWQWMHPGQHPDKNGKTGPGSGDFRPIAIIDPKKEWHKDVLDKGLFYPAECQKNGGIPILIVEFLTGEKKGTYGALLDTREISNQSEENKQEIFSIGKEASTKAFGAAMTQTVQNNSQLSLENLNQKFETGMSGKYNYVLEFDVEVTDPTEIKKIMGQ